MNAALGVRFVPDFFLAEDFLPEDFVPARLLPPDDDFFLAELFFFVAIASPGD